MKYLILIGILMASLGVGIYSSWDKLYHPAGPVEERVEPVDNQIELWCKDRDQPVINSGMLFGSLEKFKELQKTSKETSNHYRFLSDNSTVYAGWVVKAGKYDYAITKVYWTESSYYISEQDYRLGSERYITPNGIRWDYQISNNGWLIGLLTFGETLAAFLIFWWITAIFKGNILKVLEKESAEFPMLTRIPEKIKKKSGKVKFSQIQKKDSWSNWGNIHFIAVYRGRTLGSLDPIKNITLFYKFLDKFGKKMWLDDFMDSKLPGIRCDRWVIDYHVLTAGYSLFKQDKQKFEELIQKARNPQEFLMGRGVI